MYYNQSPHNGINIEFEGIEVETVREVYKERIAYLISVGNDSSVSDYQKGIAKWQGTEQNYYAATSEPLVEVLKYFSDATAERVDEILDVIGNSDRFVAAAKRYELGQNASHLLLGIEVQSALDAEWKEFGS
jgi:hypothetical protein